MVTTAYVKQNNIALKADLIWLNELNKANGLDVGISYNNENK